MDVPSIVASAIALGAAAGLRDSATQAVRDAYGSLVGLLGRNYPQVDIRALEGRPSSAAKRESLAEDVAALSIQEDSEILKAAQRLIELIRAADPQVGAAIGVDIDALLLRSSQVSSVRNRVVSRQHAHVGSMRGSQFSFGNMRITNVRQVRNAFAAAAVLIVGLVSAWFVAVQPAGRALVTIGIPLPAVLFPTPHPPNRLNDIAGQWTGGSTTTAERDDLNIGSNGAFAIQITTGTNGQPASQGCLGTAHVAGTGRYVLMFSCGTGGFTASATLSDGNRTLTMNAPTGTYVFHKTD